MNVPSELRYLKTHEWVHLEGDTATVGITDFAQSQLSDLTYIELPSVDDEVDADSEVAVLESVKAASDIYAPMSGTVIEVNEKLEEEPEIVNQSPFEDGWLFKIKVSDPSEFDALLSADEYEDLLPEE